MAAPRLNLIVVRSSDLSRAEAFYGALGIAFSREKHGNGPEHLAAVLGEVVFEIYPGRDEASTRDVRVGFRVASLEEVLAMVNANGGEIVSAPQQTQWGVQAVVADPDGRRVELLQMTESA